jgi:enoyl-CoA hydratase/carnithine racemase
MSDRVRLSLSASVASVTLSHAGKFNAMSRQMWCQLRSIFESLQDKAEVRCIVVGGEHGNFCAGGDISEYADFRFQEESLRNFHENEVWGALQAMLACDVPMVAAIEGHCMGAGMEIASCCDIRLAGVSARFGAPIARLGFPMAPREAALVAREAGLSVARQMLLEATIFSAAEMKAAGFLSRLIADEQVVFDAKAAALHIAALAPQAARLNKQTLRALTGGNGQGGDSYAYASSAEHREGVAAFLEKRKPSFSTP